MKGFYTYMIWLDGSINPIWVSTILGDKNETRS